MRVRPERPGYVLLAVLIVVTVLALAAYRFTDTMTGEYRVAVRTSEAAQAKSFAASGVNYAAGLLADPESQSQLAGATADNAGQFAGVSVGPTDGVRGGGHFSLIHPADTGGAGTSRYAPKYGVADESAKWNLNALAQDRKQTTVHDALMKLPNMTEEIADAIGDWIDSDDTPRAAGAESDYYQGLNPPYRAKNGPLNSIDELLLVRGVTPQLLYGSDRNRNGIVDPGEDSGDDLLGWSVYLTAYGRALSVDSTGATRVYINDPAADGKTLLGKLTPKMQQELADYVVAARLYGTAKAAAPSATPSRSSLLVPAARAGLVFALSQSLALESVMLQPPPAGSGGRGGQGGPPGGGQGGGRGGQGGPGGGRGGNPDGGNPGGRGGDGGGNPGGGQGRGRGENPGGNGGPGGGRGGQGRPDNSTDPNNPSGGGRPGRDGAPGGRAGRNGGTPGGNGGVPGGAGGTGRGSSPTPKTVTGGAAELRAAVQSSVDSGARLKSKIKSLTDLIDTQVTLPKSDRNAPTVIVPSPLNDPEKLKTMLPALYEAATATEGYELLPRLNVNTAPVEVLSGLPGLDQADVDALMTARAGLAPTDPATTTGAWMMTAGKLTPAKFKAIEKFVTGRTTTYRVNSVGYFARGGPVARAEAVIDTTAGHPRVLYYRDVTDLGRAGVELQR